MNSEKIYSVREISEIAAPIARRYRLERLYLFGSYARGDADAKSDIDLRTVGGRLDTLFALGGLYAELEEAFRKPLDIVTTEAIAQNLSDELTRRLVDNMRKDEMLIYEENSGS